MDWPSEMGRIDIEWIAGEPEELKTGMLVRYDGRGPFLVGDINGDAGLCDCYYIPGPVVAYSTSLIPFVNAAKLTKGPDA